MGWVYARPNRYEEAIDRDACHQAFGNPYDDIGAYFIEPRWWPEAATWLEQALTAPRYANREFARFNLGRVHESLGG